MEIYAGTKNIVMEGNMVADKDFCKQADIFCASKIVHVVKIHIKVLCACRCIFVCFTKLGS